MTASKQSQDGTATCFGNSLCPSSGGFYCTFGIGKFHAGLMTASKQSQDGTATCFGHSLCPSSGVFYSTFGIGKFHAGLMTACSSILTLFGSGHQTCMKFTNAEYTVENS